MNNLLSIVFATLITGILGVGFFIIRAMLESYFKKTDDAIKEIKESIYALKEELIRKVADNKIDNEKLNTEVEKLKTRMDNVEKIVDRRSYE